MSGIQSQRYLFAIISLLLLVLVASKKPSGITDLHVHTSLSDGVLSPLETVIEAANAGVKVLALTDYDQVPNYLAAQLEADKLHVNLIPAVSVSASWSRFPDGSDPNEDLPEYEPLHPSLHILLYHLPETDAMNSLLTNIQKLRLTWVESVVDTVQKELKLDPPITYNHVRSYIRDITEQRELHTLSLLHFAKYLVSREVYPTVREALTSDLLSAHDTTAWSLSLDEIVTLASNEGAVPVLSHATTIGLTGQELSHEIGLILARGVPLKGLECFHSDYSKIQTEELLEIAHRYNLIVTGGSGHHGNYVEDCKYCQIGEIRFAKLWANYARTAATELYKVYVSNNVWDTVGHSVVVHAGTYIAIAVMVAFVIKAYESEATSGANTVIKDAIKSVSVVNWFFYTPTVLYSKPEKGDAIELSRVDDKKRGVDDDDDDDDDDREAKEKLLDSADSDSSDTRKQKKGEEEQTGGLLAKSKLGNLGGSSSMSSSSGNGNPSATKLRFLFCFLGLQGAYLSWGYFQEQIMTQQYGSERFVYSEFLVFANRVSAMIIAAIVLRVQEKPKGHAPPIKYSFCSISNVMSSWFQYEALKFVDFPMQVLSKTSKIMFSMLTGKVLNGTSYPWSDYLMAATITAGLCIFHHGQSSLKEASAGVSASASSNSTLFVIGALMLLCYILSDSFTGQWQSRVFKTYKVNSFQMMFGVNMFSSGLLLCVMLFYGHFFPAAAFLMRHHDCALHSAAMSFCSAMGQLFIFHTIKVFGPVAFASIMTARQLFSIILSMIIFGHELSFLGGIGLCLCFSAMVYKTYKKSQGKK